MKKVYLLFLLFCISLTAGAQTIDTVFAAGATGSNTTGSAIYTPPPPAGGVYTRADGIIAVTNSTTTGQDGYAQFDISSIPVGSIVTSVVLGVNVSGFTLGTFGICKTYARLGTLSGATATTLYNDCSGTGGTLIFQSTASSTSPNSYFCSPSGVGGITMTSTASVPSTAALCTFIQSNESPIGAPAGTTLISISFSTATGTTNVYNFTGETGTSRSVAGGTSPTPPFLIITYCSTPSATAIAAPTPICTGQTFSLTGTSTGATLYQWRGPAGFSSTLLSTTGVATPTSGGVYTLTASTSCGSFGAAVATTSLTINPSPAALITTTTTVCSGNTIYMSDITAGGVWSSSNNLSATVTNGAIVGGNLAGTPTIFYRLGVCAATASITVNNAPLPISGPVEVCAFGGTITLSDAIPGGTWTSGTLTAATVDPVTGVVTGANTPGPDVISYTTGACPSVTYPITVDPLPNIITGPAAVCVNATMTLSDATLGGTWSSANTNVSVDPNTGDVTGISSGTATISYILTTGCYVTRLIAINPLPANIVGPSGVCVLLTIQLSDATGTGTWSSSSSANATIGSVNGIVTGVVAGGTNITYTLPFTGCFITYSVTVESLPDPIAGPSVVCALSSITLSDDVNGGAWSSANTNVASIDPSTGILTGVAAGGSMISYILGSTSCYTSYSVTVHPLPVTVITPAGPTTFCAGGSVVLNATTGAGYNYIWFNNGNIIGGAFTSSYTANLTEMITVQITDGNGCSNEDSVQVTLVQSAVIAAGGPLVFCQTGNVSLSVPLSPGIIYQWTLNGSPISGANTHIYAATVGGIYTCSLTIPGGCASVTPPVTVTVHPLPNPIIYYTGSALSTSNSYITYQWYLNSIAIPGATSFVVTPTVNASYRVRVTDGNDCSNYSAPFIMSNLGVELINNTAISIYPNPASKVVHIESPMAVRAVVTGVDGKTIITQEDAKELDISKLPDGLYLIMLFDNNGERVLVQKLIKE